MEIEWTILPRGDVAAHWSGLYVTLNRIGSIAMSRVTWARSGWLGQSAAVAETHDSSQSVAKGDEY